MTIPTYKIDSVPPVTEDEAMYLMLHHLALAVAYFEATPEDMGALAIAASMKFPDRLPQRAVHLFIDALHADYEALPAARDTELLTFKPASLKCALCNSTSITITLNREGTHITVVCDRCSDHRIVCTKT